MLSLTSTLIIPGIRIPNLIICFITLNFEEITTNTLSHGTQFDIALGNHTLPASGIARATRRSVTHLLADNSLRSLLSGLTSGFHPHTFKLEPCVHLYRVRTHLESP